MKLTTVCQLFVSVVCATHSVKDYHPAPPGWSKLARAPSDHVLNIRIALTQGNFAELHKQLYEVSTPNHPSYGQHLSAEQVNDLVRPRPATLEAVDSWLTNAGIASAGVKYNEAQTWISFPLTVAEAETLLNTEYSIWQHDDGSSLVRTEYFSLPEGLHDHIATVQPTNSWARLNPRIPVQDIKNLQERGKDSHIYSWSAWSASAQASTSMAATATAPASMSSSPATPSGSLAANPAAVNAACNFSAVTPDCIRTLYGTIDYTPASNLSNLGICNYLGEYNNRSDVHQFLSMYRPEAAAYALTFPQISVAGGPISNGTNTAAQGIALEGNLDAEYMLGIAYPLPLTTWATGGLDPSFVPDLYTPTNSDEPYLTWLNYILDQSDVPQMISTSYGDDEQTVSMAYANVVCNEFAQLGARGVSLLFASGDFGVGTNDTCISNVDNSTYTFLPSFPIACPYVTAVGGTRDFPETVMYVTVSGGQTAASGGGFSNYYPRPEYQNATVSNYIASLDELYSPFYNASGRAYPDISCLGQIFPTIWNGSTAGLIGTSGATPICAAVLGLVNDALLSAGKPALGFLNPWLYSGGYEGFTDVTSGTALGCNVLGFPATVGWDAVTGFGTPYLPKILKVLGL